MLLNRLEHCNRPAVLRNNRRLALFRRFKKMRKLIASFFGAFALRRTHPGTVQCCTDLVQSSECGVQLLDAPCICSYYVLMTTQPDLAI